MLAPLSRVACPQFEATELAKDKEVEKVRFKNIHLQFQLRKVEGQIKEKEQVRAERCEHRGALPATLPHPATPCPPPHTHTHSRTRVRMHNCPPMFARFPALAAAQLADGLHLIDFEQLKIENLTLNEKIEERTEELHKLSKKTTQTVQVLTHVKEKLQFVQAEAQARGARAEGWVAVGVRFSFFLGGGGGGRSE